MKEGKLNKEKTFYVQELWKLSNYKVKDMKSLKPKNPIINLKINLKDDFNKILEDILNVNENGKDFKDLNYFNEIDLKDFNNCNNNCNDLNDFNDFKMKEKDVFENFVKNYDYYDKDVNDLNDFNMNFNLDFNLN